MTPPSPEAFLLETGRLGLRQLRPGDSGLMEQLFCDPDTMRFLGGPWSVLTAAETLEEWRLQWGGRNYRYGALVLRQTGEAAGIAGFSQDTHPDEPGLELSWFVLPGHRGRGYAAEITGALRAYAFGTLGADRLLAETHPENRPALRVLGRLGFRCLGERHQEYAYLPGFDVQSLWECRREDLPC